MSEGQVSEQSAYARALVEGRDAVRRAILDTASQLLNHEGPQALSMRRIAQEVGCSTMVLYTVFTGKQQLANALYLEGFARLRRALELAGRGDNPLADLAELAQVYRSNARAHPNYYGVMFGRPIPEFEPPAESREQAARSLNVLADAAQRCIDAGIFRDADPDEVAETLWAAVHGVVSLELAGYFPNDEIADRCFHNVARAAGAWFLAAPPAANSGHVADAQVGARNDIDLG